MKGQEPAQASTQEARLDFARIVRDAEYGHPTTITRYGKPVARVVPIQNEDNQTPAMT